MHFRERSRRESLVSESRHCRRSKSCAAWLICQAGSGSALPAPSLSGGTGGTAPRSAGLASCDPPGAAAAASTALAGSKNKQTETPNYKPTRKQKGGRQGEGAGWPPPDAPRPGQGQGGSAEPPPARRRGCLSREKLLGALRGARVATQLSLPGWVRAAAGPGPPGCREAAFSLWREKQRGTEKGAVLWASTARLSALRAASERAIPPQQVFRDPMGPLGKEARAPYSQNRSTTRGSARGSRCWCCPTEPLPVAAHLSQRCEGLPSSVRPGKARNFSPKEQVNLSKIIFKKTLI